MKERRKERGQVMNGVEQGERKRREKGEEGQERGDWYPPFLYESCAAVGTCPQSPKFAASIVRPNSQIKNAFCFREPNQEARLVSVQNVSTL